MPGGLKFICWYYNKYPLEYFMRILVIMKSTFKKSTVVTKGAKWLLLGIYYVVFAHLLLSLQWVISLLQNSHNQKRECSFSKFQHEIIKSSKTDTMKPPVPDCIKSWLHVPGRKDRFFHGLSSICEVTCDKRFFSVRKSH